MAKLYIGNLSFKTTEANMKTHFESFGKIKEAKLMIYRGYSKGYGFIEYETEEYAKKALTADGVEFEGRKLKVAVARPPRDRTAEKKEGEKKETKPRQEGAPRRQYNGPRGKRPFGGRRNTRRYPTRQQGGRKPNTRRPQRKPREQKPKEESENILFVKNIAFAVKDEDLKELFKEYNVVEAKVITYKNRAGEVRSKGFGFVDVKTADDQKNAIEKLNGSTHMERKIVVAKAFKRPEAAPKKEN